MTEDELNTLIELHGGSIYLFAKDMLTPAELRKFDDASVNKHRMTYLEWSKERRKHLLRIFMARGAR